MQRNLFATITVADPGPVMTATVHVAVPDLESPPLDSSQMFATIAVDTSVGEAAQPPASGLYRQQMVGYRLEIAGREFWPADLIPPVTWTEELGAGATLSFRLAWNTSGLDADISTQDRLPWIGSALNDRALLPIGDFWTFMGVPPGRDEVNVYGIYVTATGRHEIPLMVGGCVESVMAESGLGGRFLALTVADRRVRYDKRLIDFVLPPGHGRTRGAIARAMLAKAGVPAAQLAIFSGGVSCKKGVQLLDTNAWSSAAEFMAAGGYTLEVARDGTVVALERVNVSGRVVATLGESDFRKVTYQANTEGPTLITLTGSRMAPAEERSTGLRSTPPKVTESKDPDFVPQAAVQRQANTGTLSALSLTPEGREDQLVSRVTFREFFNGDTPIGDETIEEAWFNLQAYRYELDATGAIDGYAHNVYLMTTGVLDDATLAYRWPVERFGVRSVERNGKVFDDRNFLVRKTTRRYGPVLRGAALKSRISTDPWEDEPYLVGQNVLGDGTGVPNDDDGEVLAGIGGAEGNSSSPLFGSSPSIVQEIVTEYEVTDDGYVTKETSTEWGWRQSPGALHQYADESTSADSAWQFRVVQTVVTHYVEGEGENARSVQITTDAAGRTFTVTEDLDGYLPQAEIMGEPTVDADEYTSEEAAEYALAASRFGNEPFLVTVAFPGLEATRERQHVHKSSHHAENETDGHAEAVRDAREGSAIDVTVELPAVNLLLQRGDLVRLRDRPSGTDETLHLKRISWTHPGGGQPITMTLGGSVYVL